MKITVILALTLAAICVMQAETIPEDPPLQQELQENLFQDMREQVRQKRANCQIEKCTANCSTRGLKGVCIKGRKCRCY